MARPALIVKLPVRQAKLFCNWSHTFKFPCSTMTRSIECHLLSTCRRGSFPATPTLPTRPRLRVSGFRCVSATVNCHESLGCCSRHSTLYREAMRERCGNPPQQRKGRPHRPLDPFFPAAAIPLATQSWNSRFSADQNPPTGSDAADRVEPGSSGEETTEPQEDSVGRGPVEEVELSASVAEDSPSHPAPQYSPGVEAAVAMLQFYKREISPFVPASCRFVPTCSEYGVQAFRKYGVVRGGILTAWRLARCNPFGGSGYDPPRWFGEEKPEV